MEYWSNGVAEPKDSDPKGVQLDTRSSLHQYIPHSEILYFNNLACHMLAGDAQLCAIMGQGFSNHG